MPATAPRDEERPLPIEVTHESRNRDGSEPDAGRIDELRHMGLRPNDARRIERLERTLDLPAEQDELDRVRAAAMLRAEPETRREVVGEIGWRAHDGDMTEYEALGILQDLEVIPESCDFLRTDDRYEPRLICYTAGEPVAAFKLQSCYDGMHQLPTYEAREQKDLSGYDQLPG